MLADAGRDDHVGPRGEPLKGLQHLLRLEPLLARAVAERELLAPGAKLREPRLGDGRVLRAVPRHLVGQRADGGPKRTDDRDVGAAQFRDLGRVDVEVDDGRPRREGRELPGDAVVEPRADRDEHVARVQGEVRPLRAVHPGPAEVELVRLGERALAHQRRHDRERPGLREPQELGARLAVERAAADVEHRLPRCRDRAGRLLDLQRMHFRGRSPARQVDLVVRQSRPIDLVHVVDVVAAEAVGPHPTGGVLFLEYDQTAGRREQVAGLVVDGEGAVDRLDVVVRADIADRVGRQDAGGGNALEVDPGHRRRPGLGDGPQALRRRALDRRAALLRLLGQILDDADGGCGVTPALGLGGVELTSVALFATLVTRRLRRR